MKKCSKCGEVKPLEEFYRQAKSVDGRQAYCKPCQQTHQREWDAANRHRRRGYDFRCRYGISEADYDAMLAAQGGRCALPHCRRLASESRNGRLFVDHDHDTGRVRGLLCSECNSALGKLGDSIDAITGVLNYLMEGN